MTVDKLRELFYKFSEEVQLCAFDLVENKYSERSDLHAFILIDKIFPEKTAIIGHAAHDQIFIGVEIEELAKVITEEQILELVRSGVSYDSNYDCLYMFT